MADGSDDQDRMGILELDCGLVEKVKNDRSEDGNEDCFNCELKTTLGS